MAISKITLLVMTTHTTLIFTEQLVLFDLFTGLDLMQCAKSSYCN